MFIRTGLQIADLLQIPNIWHSGGLFADVVLLAQD